jgi:hypothetical protein
MYRDLSILVIDEYMESLNRGFCIDLGALPRPYYPSDEESPKREVSVLMARLCESHALLSEDR